MEWAKMNMTGNSESGTIERSCIEKAQNPHGCSMGCYQDPNSVLRRCCRWVFISAASTDMPSMV